MKIDYKKMLWVLVSCIMALSLIITSCETETEERWQSNHNRNRRTPG
jgi:hypothetical protein